MTSPLLSPGVARLLALVLAPLTFAGSTAWGQQGTAAPRTARGFDSTGVGDTSIFAPIRHPSPNDYRSASGAPGHAYWQNRADYEIRATLDTAARTLRGDLTLRYTNNSPDTLRFLWLHLEQNAFKSDAMNGLIFSQGARYGARGFDGGDVIDRIVQRTVGGKTSPVATRTEGTMMKVTLAQPLAPKATATVDIAWHFMIPDHGADRMGRDGALYEIAQWYPRVAVYDDIRGWNIEQYLGQGEFYLDYGDFTLALTVPAGYIVAATGMLVNPREVLPPTQAARLAAAARSDTVVRIITAAELADGSARPTRRGTLTWRFVARNVRDAVFAASPEYQWDATSWSGKLAFAYYRSNAAVNWHDAADMARMSIQEYSERWFEYPWPQISAVEGPISGMEYPMIAMETKGDDKYDLYNVVTHEIGHMWYPMIVGSNERTYMWQDEGFDTFINTFSEARRYPDKGDQLSRALAERSLVEQMMKMKLDEPVDINPDRIKPQQLGVAAYVKPSVALQQLREEILGPAAFDDAFRTYTARWAFKHPTPTDFFRTMEEVAGRRLDWFWREFFLENPHFDQAIDTVTTLQKGDSQVVAVAFANRARGVLPIRARFVFTDGTSQEFRYPAEVWSVNTRRYVRQYRFGGKQLARVELDPERRLLDIDRENNVYQVARPSVVP